MRVHVRSLSRLALLATLGTTIPLASAQTTTPLTERLLVQPNGGVSSAELRTLFDRHKLARLKRVHGINLHVVRVAADRVAATEATLRADPRIRSVERDRLLAPAQLPNDTNFPAQYHLMRIGCPAAWDMTTGSIRTPIAILDSGVDATHPDLADKVIAGFNMVDDTTDTHDVYGHGTMVAGVAAAASNNGLGVTGVAWASPIMPIRVTDTNGFAFGSTLSAGLVWAADHGARVANISFTVFGASWLSPAAQYFASKGGVTFAAAGNDGAGHNEPDNPWVVSVAATDANDQRASFSSYGPFVDLAAPGVDIVTTGGGGQYTSVSGTSFASPVVAGVAALLLGVSPTLTPTQIVDLLTGNARDLGAGGYDPMCGWGRVDAANAVAAAHVLVSRPDTTPPSVVVRSPTSGASVSGTVTVDVAASDDVAVTRVVLYADNRPVGALTTAPYRFTWNASTLPLGAHTLLTAGFDAAGNRGVSAAVQVTTIIAKRPAVRLTAPLANTTYRAPAVIAMSAVVADNVGSTRVTFSVDDRARSSDSFAPYSRPLDLSTLARGTHSVVATAVDATGKVGTSQRIVLIKAF